MTKKMSFAAFLLVFMLIVCQGQASAQLFRFRQDRDKKDESDEARSILPNITNIPQTISDYYSADAVSEVVRDEIAGRVPVRPVPDFLGKADFYQNLTDASKPKVYRANRRDESSGAVRPPAQMFFYDRYDTMRPIDQAETHKQAVQNNIPPLS